MSFEWLDRTPAAKDGGERRAQAACAELAQRAALLYRLGFSVAAATERLRARVAWEEGDQRHPSLSDESVGKIVHDTYARRPGSGH
jgi:hypothetical protein